MTKESEAKKLHNIRHTLAHLLAQAVLEKYPHAKPTLGPPIENGFYYDFDFSGGDASNPEMQTPGEGDLKALEKAMRKNLSKWQKWESKTVTPNEAREVFADNKFKKELIDNLEKDGETITLYTCGGFTDLCRGGHIDNPKETIDPRAFKLSKIAGAYWRGDEKNKMLTRIYGLAFETKEELLKYLHMIEEAKKRDHRKIGKELGLFTFSELVGPGLPLWTQKGTIVRELIDAFVQELRTQKGYQRVTIPHIAKKTLYETSGHWQKYSEDLFKVGTKEESDHEEYVLKPMNCPHHTQIFDAIPRSYRDMPQRFAETTMVYRAEQSGELAGLTRVLSITQDDAHVFCRESQLKTEINAIWDIINTFYGAFKFSDIKVRLSFHDPENKDEYLGDNKTWEQTESLMKEIAENRKADYFIGIGEAAFYAPKLDFMASDALGRTHQVATIQLDRLLPERFDLTFINENGERERPVMIHAAITGSIERFVAVLIEHLNGNFPTWLSPEQVRIVPVAKVHEEYAHKVLAGLQALDIRATLHDASDSLGKRIRNAKKDKIPYTLVLGDKEQKTHSVTAEMRDGGKLEVSMNEFVEKIKKEIDERMA